MQGVLEALHAFESPVRVCFWCWKQIDSSQAELDNTNRSALWQKIYSYSGILGYLEKFLAFFDSSMEFADKMSDVEAKCNLDYGGAELYKYIMILLRVCNNKSSFVHFV